MFDDEHPDLPPLPVIPSWGSMVPETPSQGYADMRFDLDPARLPELPPSGSPTRLDLAAADALERRLPI